MIKFILKKHTILNVPIFIYIRLNLFYLYLYFYKSILSLFLTLSPSPSLSPSLQVLEVKPEWLVEIAPHYYKKKVTQKGAVGKGRRGEQEGGGSQLVVEVE